MQNDAPESEHTPARPPRPEIEILVGRALKLRCPRCGKGRLFSRGFAMNRCCPECGLLFDRAPGYYLGSTYINYGITAWVITVLFLVGRFYLHIEGNRLLWPLFVFCLIFPLLIFRQARALWLAFDCQFDQSVLDDEWREPKP
jgi:uncharacterized protein (DUF983 family)